MAFWIGMAVGSLITFVVFVAYMAPKHWDWYHQNVDLKAALRNRTEERDHYKNLVSPIQWGPQELHEARIVARREAKVVPYEGVTIEPGESVDFVFDDIKDGGSI